MYAVVQTGSKQYRVSVGDSIKVERLDADPGAEVTLDQVLMLADDDNVKIGTPVVEGARVVASVDSHTRGEKITIFKMRPKKRYRKKQGHRQNHTNLTIKEITGA